MPHCWKSHVAAHLVAASELIVAKSYRRSAGSGQGFQRLTPWADPGGGQGMGIQVNPQENHKCLLHV